jgi:predicted metal-dependent hydrolase
LYPSEYIQFLAHFHGDRDYFECHELLEDYWKQTDSRNKDSIWVGFILLSVSAYHHRRNNFSGAIRTLIKALRIFEFQPDTLTKLGLNKVKLIQLLKEQASALQNGEAYRSYSLPICDPSLTELAAKACEQQGFFWGNESDMTNKFIIDRHKLRDRTSVIEERNQSLKTRKGSE